VVEITFQNIFFIFKKFIFNTYISKQFKNIKLKLKILKNIIKSQFQTPRIKYEMFANIPATVRANKI